jgi:hypothetical protein
MITINYNMNGRSVLSAINSNIAEIERLATGSNDFGATWKELPDKYLQYLTPDHFLSVQRPYKKDSDGYILVQNSSVASQCAQYSFLIKMINKPT